MKNRLITAARIICLLLVVNSLFSQEGTQPMAIIPGSIVSFGGGSSGEVPAMCLNRFAEAPHPGKDVFNANGSYSGNIRFKYENGTWSKPLSFQKAIKDGLIQLQGVKGSWFGISGRPDVMRIIKGASLNNVTSVEFLGGNIAIPSDYSYRFSKDRLKQFFNEYVENRSDYADPQNALWEQQIREVKAEAIQSIKESSKQFNQIKHNLNVVDAGIGGRNIKYYKPGFSNREIDHPSGKSIGIVSKNYDPGNPLKVFQISLLDGGSSTLIETKDRHLILIDGGKTERDAVGTIDFIQKNFAGGIERLLVLNSHSDEDHLGGIVSMIKNGLNFPQILMPNTGNSETGSKQLQRFREEIAGPYEYKESNIDDHGEKFIVFTKSNSLSLQSGIKIVDLFSIDPSMTFGRLQLKDVSANILLTNYHTVKSVNNKSLILRFFNNNREIIIMGDAGIPALRKDLIVQQWRKNEWAKLDLRVTEAERRIKEVESKSYSVAEGGDHADFNIAKKDADVLKELVSKLKQDVDNLETFNNPRSESYLVWPHHYWSPKDPEDIELLREWLKITNPKVIYITKPPLHARQDRTRLEAFFREVKSRTGMQFEVRFVDGLEKDKYKSLFFWVLRKETSKTGSC